MKREFYNSIEGFRGLAILMVLISHMVIVPFLYKLIPLKFGYLGVNWFFVLSGFLITEILIVEMENGEKPIQIIKSFFAKRTLRIFPIYYLVIFLLISFNLGGIRNCWVWVCTYTYNIGRVFFDVKAGLIGHTWSLDVEEQFYMLWPFLLLLFKNNKLLLMVLMVIIFSLIKLWYYYTVSPINYDFFLATPFASFDALAIGGILAYLKCYEIEKLKSILDLIWLPFALLICFWVLMFIYEDHSFFYLILGRVWTAIVGFYFIGWCALDYELKFVQLFQAKWISYLGKISYGIYLYHYVLQHLLDDFFYRHYVLVKPYIGILYYHRYIFYFIFMASISIVVSHISFFYFEKPILKLKNRF